MHITLLPNATSLVESLRDIGYSLESAVADIIDNSITALAKNIHIHFDQYPSFKIAIVDDGSGMDYDELINAMKIGNKNPLDERDKNDLGRFGLGLKTASFSQSRKLTVISRKNGTVNGTIWDLDFIAQTNDWTLKILNDAEIRNAYKYEQLLKDGTLVIWENNDRIIDNTLENKREDASYEKIDNTRKHLELVFHRYLEGESNKIKKVNMFINNEPLVAFDPFNKKNIATQLLQDDIIPIDGKSIKIQPYILPHHSKVSKKEYEYYERGDYLKNQGFYVYRNARLLVHGTWFRIIPQKELYKLARIQIDLPNDLDHIWKIDVKKSHASPPAIIKERLKHIIDKIVGKSTRVYIGRGHRQSSVSESFWKKESARGEVKYAINKEHPLIREFMEELESYKKEDFKQLLDYIATFFPLDLAMSDYAQNPSDFKNNFLNDEELEKIATIKIMQLRDKLEEDDFIDFFHNTEPFNKYTKDWKYFLRKFYA